MAADGGHGFLVFAAPHLGHEARNVYAGRAGSGTGGLVAVSVGRKRAALGGHVPFPLRAETEERAAQGDVGRAFFTTEGLGHGRELLQVVVRALAPAHLGHQAQGVQYAFPGRSGQGPAVGLGKGGLGVIDHAAVLGHQPDRVRAVGKAGGGHLLRGQGQAGLFRFEEAARPLVQSDELGLGQGRFPAGGPDQFLEGQAVGDFQKAAARQAVPAHGHQLAAALQAAPQGLVSRGAQPEHQKGLVPGGQGLHQGRAGRPGGRGLGRRGQLDLQWPLAVKLPIAHLGAGFFQPQAEFLQMGGQENLQIEDPGQVGGDETGLQEAPGTGIQKSAPHQALFVHFPGVHHQAGLVAGHGSLPFDEQGKGVRPAFPGPAGPQFQKDLAVRHVAGLLQGLEAAGVQIVFQAGRSGLAAEVQQGRGKGQVFLILIHLARLTGPERGIEVFPYTPKDLFFLGFGVKSGGVTTGQTR